MSSDPPISINLGPGTEFWLVEETFKDKDVDWVETICGGFEVRRVEGSAIDGSLEGFVWCEASARFPS